VSDRTAAIITVVLLALFIAAVALWVVFIGPPPTG